MHGGLIQNYTHKLKSKCKHCCFMATSVHAGRLYGQVISNIIKEDYFSCTFQVFNKVHSNIRWQKCLLEPVPED